MTARIFIDGEAGTTGLQIRDELADAAGISLVSLAAADRKDVEAKRRLLAEVDVVILCLPDAAARETVALVDGLGPRGPRIIDASTAHRTAEGWTYGFAEMSEGQGARIARARRVANPGCYATGAIALLRPLIDAGLLPASFPVTINAVSGYSGGGKSMIQAYESGAAPPFQLYALGLEHKHVPEIMTWSGLTLRPLFVPSVGNFRQGMLVSVPLHLDALPGSVRAADLGGALQAHYAGAECVTVEGAAEAGLIDATALNGTNRMTLHVLANEERRHAVLVARLDNLGKGASGAAVQNLRLMLGGAETR
jgi:N-acetyl-gamma-glutamyl-phosphate reductase